MEYRRGRITRDYRRWGRRARLARFRARSERMSAADPTPAVKSNATISDRLASIIRSSMFPHSAQPLGAGRVSGLTGAYCFSSVPSPVSSGPESPPDPLGVSGSAVDTYSRDAQVGDAHARVRWHESAVRPRIQKVPTFRQTGHEPWGTGVTDQLQRKPRADPLDVRQNGQDRRLDVAIGANALCVLDYETRALPET